MQPDFAVVSPVSFNDVNAVQFARGIARTSNCILGAIVSGVESTRFYTINRSTGAIATFGTTPNDRFETNEPGSDARQHIDHLPSTNYWFITQSQGGGNGSKFKKLDI